MFSSMWVDVYVGYGFSVIIYSEEELKILTIQPGVSTRVYIEADDSSLLFLNT